VGRDGAADLLADAGVLLEAPLVEFFGWEMVERRGGLAVLPCRGDWLAAAAAGVEAVSLPEKIGAQRFSQAVIHLQKGRAPTDEALAAAWNALEEGGRLLLVGGNSLGIKSAVRNLGRILGQEARILSNRAHSRVALFLRTSGSGPSAPAEGSFMLETPAGSVEIRTRPGVFAFGRLDAASALLLRELEHLRFEAPTRILDPGCGSGVLGLAAALRWPEAQLVLADHDRRAVDAARKNFARSGLGDRAEILWWDALTEEIPGPGVDLALVNPPFHRGRDVDLDAPFAFFRKVGAVMTRGGTALLVANTTLPYEKKLREAAAVSCLRREKGYKLLKLEF